MAASDPAGGQKFWFNGIPFQGVAKSGTDPTGLKFWFNGVPFDSIIPSGVVAEKVPYNPWPQLGPILAT